MLLNVFTGRRSQNTLTGMITNQGFNGGTMRRECGFKLDYEKVNESTEAFR